MAGTTPTTPEGTQATQGTNNGALVAPQMGPATSPNASPTSILGNGQIGPLLPNPQTSSTGPTGVANSDLADQTLATQNQGMANINNRITANQQVQPQVSYNTLLSNALTASGKPTDFSSKSQLAQQAGIHNYVGSQQQDAQLYGYLNSQQANAGANQGTTGTAGATSTSTQASGGSTSPTTGTSGTTGTTSPTIPPTGALGIFANNPGNAYNAPIQALNSQLNQNYTSQTNLLNTYMSNPMSLLNSAQIANLQAVQGQFSAIAEQQAIANKAYLGQVTEANAKLGIEATSPTQMFASQQEAISDGLQKLNSLAATAATTISGLQQSFIDKDYTAINDGYTNLQKNLEDQVATQESLQKTATDLYTASVDYNQKAEQFAQSQAQQKQEFEQTQGLEMEKIALQYPGIDPATGQVKPGTDISTLPGFTQIPQSAGVGSGVLDLSSIDTSGSPGYANALAQVAKANGYGVVSAQAGPAYHQALGALTGLQGAIANGSLNPNNTIAQDIQDKVGTTLMIQWFGSTNPDNIAAALGSGGASVPDLKTLTWAQAVPFLQGNINAITGSSPEKQQAVSSANALLNAANNGVSTSVTSNPVLSTVYSQLFQ